MRLVYGFVIASLALASCTQNTLRGRGPAPTTEKPTGAPPLSPPEGDGSGVGVVPPTHIEPPPGSTVVPPTVQTLPPSITALPTFPPIGFPTQNPNGFPTQSPNGFPTANPTNFPPGNGGNPPQTVAPSTPVPTSRSLWVNLDCGQENQNNIGYRVGAQPFNVAAYSTAFCARPVNVTGPGQPIDFYFVIDMTGSMQPVLDTIRNNILEFATIVSKQSSSARFGAVGFRSPGDERLPDIKPPTHYKQAITLTDVNSFRNQLMNWRVQGGSQLEAGQAGIFTALDLMQKEAQSNPSRKTVSKTIFYVTDQLGILDWFLPHRTDTNDLKNKINEAKGSLPNLQFFYSATNVRSNTGHNNDPRFAKTPAEQSAEILSHFGNRGKGYPFPFTKDDFLNKLSKDIMGPPVEASGVCYISRATLTNASNQVFGTINFNSYSAAYSAAMLNGGVRYTRLSTLGMTNYDSYRANVTRCCVANANTTTACLKTYDSSFQFRLNP